MKWLFKVSTFLHMLLLCFLLSGTHSHLAMFADISSRPSPHTDIQRGDHDQAGMNHNEAFFSPGLLFNGVCRTENNAGNSSPVPSPLLKHHVSDYFVFRHIKEVRFSNIITGYIGFAKVLVVKFPPTDISFPFSYFL